MQVKSRKIKLISGIGVDAIGSIISIIVGFMAIPYFFDYISKEQYGLWLAINGLVALISVVDIGTDQYLTTVVADDSKFYSFEIGNYILSTLVIKFLIASIFMGVGLIIYIFISYILVINSSDINISRNTYVLALLTLVFTLFMGTISTILYARQHFTLINTLTSVVGVITSFGTIFLLSLNFNIAAFPSAILIASIFQFSILFIFLVINYPHINLNLTKFKFINKYEMIQYATSFQILKWIHILRTQYIIIAINNLVGPSSAALYTLTYRLPQMVIVFASKIAIPFFPAFSEYFANEKIEIAANIFIKINLFLFRFALFGAIVCFVVTKSFVSLWVGTINFAGNNTLLLLCFYVFIIASMGVFGIIIYSSKKFEKWTYVSFVEVICAITLSYVLSFKLGLFGLVAGFVFASIISQLYLFKIVLNQLKIPINYFIKKIFLYSVGKNISTIFVAIITWWFIEISDWIELISLCTIFVLIHLLLSEGLLFFKSTELGVKARFKSIIKL